VRLLTVDYALPLNDVNRPNGDEASFTVRQTVGVPPQRIVAFELWMSTDDGTSWRAVPAVARDADRFVATLPTVEVGRPVSLRVRVSGDAGSQLDQTIIRAYRTQ
jgi:hypothetical protein